jgi:hypothetical protein
MKRLNIESLFDEYRAGGITRREFIRRAILLTGSTVIATGLVQEMLSTRAWADTVALNTSASATETGADNAVSATIAAAGSNRLLVCGVHISGTGITVSGVTHGGVALTRSTVGLIAGPGGGSFTRLDVWYLIAPATGSQTVTATLSSGANKALTCIAFTGANQVTPFGTGGSYSDTNNPSTVTITVPANGMGVAFNTNNDQATAGSFTVDASSTKRFDFADTDGNIAAIASTKTAAGAAAMTISNPLPDYSVMVALPINPAPAEEAREAIIVE